MDRKNTNGTVKLIITVFGVTALLFITSCRNSSNYSENKTKDSCRCSTGNLLKNPSFEDSTETSAAFWTKGTGCWYKTSKEYQGHHPDKLYIAGNAHTGEKCLAITGTKGGMTKWYTQDVYLVEGCKYRFSCWIKTAWPDMAGRIFIPGVGVDIYFSDTTSWARAEECFTATRTGSESIFLMGHGLGTAFNGTGDVFFDDISVEMVQ